MRRIVGLLLLALALPTVGQAQDALDDVMQHAPMASVFVLRACGVESQSASWTELAATAAASYVVAAGTTYALKHTIHEWRPDDSDRRSFPSGHATFAFAGATTFRHEYGHLSPWVTVGGYSLAALVAADRVRRDRHYAHDVLAGAAIGTLSTELTYYIKKRCIKSDNVDVVFTGQSLEVAVRW